MDVQALSAPKGVNISHSVSSANAFRRCPRLYFYQYIQGWQDNFKSEALQFGTKIDELLEVLDKSNLELALQAIPDKFNDPFKQAEVELLLKLWHKEYADTEPLPPHSFDHRPGNQFGFRIPFHGNTMTGHVNLTVSGYIDKVTIIAGDVGFMEGKTSKDAIDPHSDYWTKLEMDPQIACYAWALSKELGRPVNWCWYQVIRRPSPTASSAFNRTHTVKGEVVPYSLEEYRERLSELLVKTPTKALVARKRIYISDERKNQFITEHAQNFGDIQYHRDTQRLLEDAGHPGVFAWPRNHLGCSMYGGCSFWDICTNKTTVENSGKFHKRIKNAH